MQQKRCRTFHVITLIVAAIALSNQAVSMEPESTGSPMGHQPNAHQQQGAPVTVPIGVIAAGTRWGVEVAKACGLSEKKALVAGGFVGTAITVICHIDDNKSRNDSSLLRFKVSGKDVQVDVKSLAAQVIIENALFFAPEIMSKIKSCMWPAKKKEAHDECHSCHTKMCRDCKSPLNHR